MTALLSVSIRPRLMKLSFLAIRLIFLAASMPTLHLFIVFDGRFTTNKQLRTSAKNACGGDI